MRAGNTQVWDGKDVAGGGGVSSDTRANGAVGDSDDGEGDVAERYEVVAGGWVALESLSTTSKDRCEALCNDGWISFDDFQSSKNLMPIKESLSSDPSTWSLDFGFWRDGSLSSEFVSTNSAHKSYRSLFQKEEDNVLWPDTKVQSSQFLK